MQTATINPKYVNQPKPGAFSGSVKDGNGTYWSVPQNLLHLFQPGVMATVEYEAVEKNGKTFYNVKQIVGHAAPPAAPAPAYTPPPPPPPQQPAPSTPYANGHAHPANGQNKDRAMFVMGCVGRAMGSGGFSVNDVKILALAADDAWSELERRWNR